MAILIKEISDQRKSALVAGTSLVIMAIASFFSYGFVHESLVVQGNPIATFNNIVSSNNLFKAEILGWLIILICDIVVAWAFYIFLEPIHKSLSLLGAWLRLTYSTILGIAILHLLIVGYVTLKSDRIPKVISILLLLASIGYMVINLSKTFLSQYDGLISVLNLVFMIPMIAGELGFGIWLLLRGGKPPKST
ncbi:DUF4386 domain-containing protein [Paenibacillus sp. N3.4]|uniref:DUF4386 domain-containing protein n=1 Tax=Paenibacillus sp. N3.4 TaxID=2603222 RepID=UPI0011C99866|nr:DUF4386 domain-containing protein [Paenibacillus sp. N3.4]TXK84847.1 DUF4386 domain-containing protein [Paenibacillus sp. N3.4]